MALAHYIGYAENASTGKPLKDVVIRVYSATGNVLQSVFADISETPKPVVSSDDNGAYDFYIADGNYDIEYVYNGVVRDRISRIAIFNPENYKELADFGTFGETLVSSETATEALTDLGLTLPSGSTKIGTILDGAMARSRVLSDKLSDCVSVLDFYEATDPDFTNAFERAIYQYAPALDSLEIFVPAGDYILSRQIIPRRSITLRGSGLATTRLRFNNVASINATMKGAISLGLETTLTAYTTNPGSYPVRPNTLTAGGADQSQIIDLAIIIQGTRPAGFDYGIWNAARAVVGNVMLYSCGLKTVSGALIIGSGSIVGNANTSLYHNVNSLFAPEYAFITDGTDSNNATFDRCSAFVPAIIGFYEGSQFGNAYYNCHREGVVGTTTHGYRSINPGGSNKSVFTNCYNEGDACTVARWDIASGNGIMSYQGAVPEVLGIGKNTWFSPQNLAGWVTAGQINCAADGDGFSLGSASVAATRMATDAFSVRGGDGSIGQLLRGGDGVYLTKNGAAVMKLELGGAITSPTGGATVDAEARTAINAILATMRAFKPTIAT